MIYIYIYINTCISWDRRTRYLATPRTSHVSRPSCRRGVRRIARVGRGAAATAIVTSNVGSILEAFVASHCGSNWLRNGS